MTLKVTQGIITKFDNNSSNSRCFNYVIRIIYSASSGRPPTSTWNHHIFPIIQIRGFNDLFRSQCDFIMDTIQTSHSFLMS